MELTAAAAILTGSAILLPSVKRVPKINTTEVLCRTGVRVATPEEQSLLQLRITQAGINIKPEWFMGLKVFTAGGWLILTLPLLILSKSWLILTLFAPLFYFLPDWWLKNKRAARQSAIKLSLADFTIMLSTTLSAGAGLLTALRESARGAGGPLKDEIDLTIRDHLSGKPLMDALMDMSVRTDVDELNSLVRTLNQVYSHGSPLAETMQSYSEQMRLVRKFETMDAAGSLSVKMVIPVLFFILVPCIAVIAYPAVYALMQALL